MEVTPEMIEAVRLHEKTERNRQAEEYRRREEKQTRLRAGALAQARTVVGGLTEETFTTLQDIFSDYLQELSTTGDLRNNPLRCYV